MPGFHFLLSIRRLLPVSVNEPLWLTFLHMDFTEITDVMYIESRVQAIRTPEHFTKLVQEISLQNEDCLVNFVFVSLFTYVAVEAVLQIVRNRLIAQLYMLNVMELLDICFYCVVYVLLYCVYFLLYCGVLRQFEKKNECL
jgi:hypothetical protein